MLSRRHILLYIAFGSVLCGLLPELNAQSEKSDLALLERPGHHALIRHAIAPGTGDPSNFTLADCSTQRNLNGEGKKQARSLGNSFRTANIIPTLILSSKWCRTLDTANEMDLGSVTPFPLLNSVWTRSTQDTQVQTKALETYLKEVNQDTTLLMVTHAVNISALTGESVASGHGLIITVRNDQIKVVGRIRAD